MTFNQISAGDPGNAAPVMQNFRHINYGNDFIPVDSNGAGTNNTLNFGSAAYKWGHQYFAGRTNKYSDDESTLYQDWITDSGYNYLRSYGDFTIKTLWSVGDIAADDMESTLRLSLSDVDETNSEFMDLYVNNYIGIDTTMGISIQKRGTGTYKDFVFRTDDGTTTTNFLVIDGTNGASYFENGYVGIGTPSPGTNLEIFKGLDGLGFSLYGANASGVRASILTNDASNFTAWYSWDDDTSAFNTMYVGSSDGSQGIVIDSSGNVGIGTDSPGSISGSGAVAKFQVGDGSDNVYASIKAGTNNDASWFFENDARTIKMGVTSTDLFTIYEETGAINKTLFSIDTAGNVGIGTSSPSTVLTIKGGSNANANEVNKISLGWGSRLGAGIAAVALNDDVQTIPNIGLAFYTQHQGQGTQERLRVLPGGNLGVGTSNPLYLTDTAKSNSGATNTSAIRNTSNTSASSATHLIEVAGSSSGDPLTQWSVSGVTNWYAGVDNSDSDKWKLSKNSNLSSAAIEVDASNNITFNGNLTGINQLNTVTSAELLQIANIDSSTISTAQWGYLGAMNQNLITSSDVTFNSVTATNQPRCSLYLNTDKNVSGTYTVAWANEEYDTDSMHNTSTNTERITINEAGSYMFTFSFDITSTGSGTLGGGESFTCGVVLDNSSGTVINRWQKVLDNETRKDVISGVIYCNSGDYFEAFITESTPDTITLESLKENTNFTVHKLN